MDLTDESFHRLVEGLDGIIWEADADTLEFHFVSAQVEKILGYTPDEWLSRPDFWQSRIHPEEESWVVDAYIAASARREDHRLTYRMIARDGREVWLQDNVVVSTKDGRAILHGAMLDVTGIMDQARSAEEFERRKGQYQGFYDLVPVALWHEDWSALTDGLTRLKAEGVTDLDAYISANPDFVNELLGHLKILNVNKAAVTMYGAKSSAELIARATYIFEADRPDSIFQTALHAIWTGKRDIEGTAILRRLDGFLCRVAYRASLPTLYGNGRALLSEMDITAMHDANQRLELVTRATSDVIWDFDVINDQMWASDGLQRNFGLDPAAMQGSLQKWTERIHPDDVPTLMEHFDKVILGGQEEWNREYRFLHGDGRYALVQDSGFIIRDHEGRATRMVGSLVDITQRRDLEERFNQAQRLEAIGRLTGGIAHDFNNLLTIILGNLEVMSESIGNEPGLRHNLDTALHAVDRSTEMINRLLAFSRNQPLAMQSCDLTALLAQMVPLLQGMLGNTIAVDIDLPADLWPCNADPGQLESALLNLAINARDAMESGGTFSITASNVWVDPESAPDQIGLQAGAYVLLKLTDTGQGMDESTRARAFDPFFTTKQVGRGTGLGLSIVHGFVTQSKGLAQIQSAPGQGTSILIYLPRPAQPMGTLGDQGARTDMSAEALKPATQGMGKILLVEDQALVREHVYMTLSKLGYDVLAASAAREALDILQDGVPVDLLLTDIILPGEMTGFELAQNARALRPTLPVIYTSGYSGTLSDESETLVAGVNFLWKPYRRSDLARIVHAALEDLRP